MRFKEERIHNFNNRVAHNRRRTARSAQCTLHHIVACVLLLCVSPTIAQTVIRANATIDTTKIRIGEHLRLNLEAEVSKDIQIFFPQIPDSLNRLEVVERLKMDTVNSTDGNVSTFKQTLILTSFDAGQYYLAPFKFYYRTSQRIDSIETEALMFQVETVPVDTTKAIKDIKPPLDVPFTLREALPYILGVLGALALIILAWWLYKKFGRKKEEVTPKVPPRPAHEIAFKALKKLQDLKLWQQGFYKQYHSEVSDIIRTYIENRFAVPAMEMTTDETLQYFKGRKLISKEAHEKLKFILQLADTVKFAKANPIAIENEQSMQYAHDFVMLTKVVTAGDVAAAENLQEDRS